MKDLQNQNYVNSESNNPPIILKYSHKSLQYRLSSNSSKKEMFSEFKYINALEESKRKVWNTCK